MSISRERVTPYGIPDLAADPRFTWMIIPLHNRHVGINLLSRAFNWGFPICSVHFIDSCVIPLKHDGNVNTAYINIKTFYTVPTQCMYQYRMNSRTSVVSVNTDNQFSSMKIPYFSCGWSRKPSLQPQGSAALTTRHPSIRKSWH
jgi:hypothetical protein